MPVAEDHPLPLFLPFNARLLMLGSFPPPQRRWSMDFYYPNMQNDMWRIFGLVFFEDKDYFILPSKKAFNKERIVDFLSYKGIALGDMGMKVIRKKENASDQFLEIITALDIEKILLSLPECNHIAVTGQKAADTLLRILPVTEPKVEAYSEFGYKGKLMRLYRMPSTSRAYPKPLIEKSKAYKIMFEECGLLP